MTPNEIDTAARIIRPLLSRELSLCRAVYPPTHPDADKVTGRVSAALAEFDRLILFARSAANGKPHPVTGSIVVLTTAHIGAPLPDGSPGDVHDKMDVRDENLKSWCQRCHLTFDIKEHMQRAAATRRRKRAEQSGQLELIG